MVKLTSGYSDFSLVTSISPSLDLGVTQQSYNEFKNPLTPRPTPRSTTRLPSLSPPVILLAIEDDVRMTNDSNVTFEILPVGILTTFGITLSIMTIMTIMMTIKNIRRNGTLQVLKNQGRHRQEIASNGNSSSYEVQEENRRISEGSSQTEFQERHTVAPMAASGLDRTNYFDSLSSALCAKNPYSLDSRSLHVVVGPDGESCQSGDTFLSVPSGALLFPTEIILMIFLDEGAMPPYEILQNMSVFSPVLSLEPHNLTFRVPVRVRFPFTAREGWTVNLMRQDPESGWHSVLTIDTDTFEQISLDSHCSFFEHSSELQLSHFCKYVWCGRKKENASLSRKKLGCSLFARLDSAATSCQFILCLHDYCDEAYQETKKLLPRSKPRFKLKDRSVIDIGLEGYLKILMQPGSLHLDSENPVIISLKDLWRCFGMQERVNFSAKLRTQSGNFNKDLKVIFHLTSETGSCKQDRKLLAIFGDTDETKSEPSQEDQHSTLSSGHGSISSVCEASSSFEESDSSPYLNPRTASNASNASSGKSQTESAVPPEPTEVKERQIDHNSESYLSMESLQVPSRGHLLTFFKWLEVNEVVDYNGANIYIRNAGVLVHFPKGAIDESSEFQFRIAFFRPADDTLKLARSQSIFLDVIQLMPHGASFLRPVQIYLPHFLQVDEERPTKVIIRQCASAGAGKEWTNDFEIQCTIGVEVTLPDGLIVTVLKNFIRLSKTHFCEICIEVEGRLKLTASAFLDTSGLQQTPPILNASLLLTCSNPEKILAAKDSFLRRRGNYRLLWERPFEVLSTAEENFSFEIRRVSSGWTTEYEPQQKYTSRDIQFVALRKSVEPLMWHIRFKSDGKIRSALQSSFVAEIVFAGSFSPVQEYVQIKDHKETVKVSSSKEGATNLGCGDLLNSQYDNISMAGSKLQNSIPVANPSHFHLLIFFAQQFEQSSAQNVFEAQTLTKFEPTYWDLLPGLSVCENWNSSGLTVAMMTQAEMGETACTTRLTKFRDYFRADMIVMLGTCSGVEDCDRGVEYGSVVVAKRTVIEGGTIRSNGDHFPYANVLSIDEDLLVSINTVVEELRNSEQKWLEVIPTDMRCPSPRRAKEIVLNTVVTNGCRMKKQDLYQALKRVETSRRFPWDLILKYMSGWIRDSQGQVEATEDGLSYKEQSFQFPREDEIRVMVDSIGSLRCKTENLPNDLATLKERMSDYKVNVFDMESHHFMNQCKALFPDCLPLVVKGIARYGTGEKIHKYYKDYAAATPAAFLRHILTQKTIINWLSVKFAWQGSVSSTSSS
jgi:hypothetical protein